MANVQIPNLPVAIALNGQEQLEAVQAGVSVRITTAQIGALAPTGPTGPAGPAGSAGAVGPTGPTGPAGGVPGGSTTQIQYNNAGAFAGAAGITTDGTSLTVSGSTAGNLVRITQTGAGNALVVEDSANPDASPFVVDQNGVVIQGSTTTITGASSVVNTIQTHSTSGAAGYAVSRWVASAADAVSQMLKSRGAAVGTRGIVSNGDSLGQLVWAGDDGVAFIPAASIRGQVDGTPDVNDMPGRLLFFTTADGAASPTERMRITNAGNVGIGTSSPGALLNVVANTATDAVRITQTGAGNAFMVEDSANPDATPFVVDAEGRVVRGNTSIVNVRGVSHGFQIVGSTFANASELFLRFSADASPSGVEFAKTRSTTASGNAIVSSGDGIALFVFSADDGTQYTQAASMAVSVDGTPGVNDMPGRIVFSTTADGASTPTERMRIDNQGNIGLGSTTFGTSATRTLSIGTGVAPTTGPADTIQIYSTDLSAGNTILSLFTEGTPVNANTTAAATHRIAVRINGTVYYLLANTAA